VGNHSKLSLSKEELEQLNSKSGLLKLLKSKEIDIERILSQLTYEEELIQLQQELIKLQQWVQGKGKRVAILFEGRDVAGKGGSIQRFTQHLNPRFMRIVALPKPTEIEKGQWYFQRYTQHLPNRGEIVFFDRSWYNRAVVEPVNGFCSKKQYQRFMLQVPGFEHMLHEDGIILIKFWFSITKEEQTRRFKARKTNPLKQWKLSPVDMKAQELWDKYTEYKEAMFGKTHTVYCPWIIVNANDKRKARLASIRYVLTTIPYIGKKKAKLNLFPDPDVVSRYHRG